MKRILSVVGFFFLVGILCLTQSFAQWSSNPNVNTPICFAPNTQYVYGIISDGAGGAIILWIDYRSGISYDIYAQRVNRNGTIQWNGSGVAICTVAGSQDPRPTIVSDGVGGAIITWNDYRSGNYDIYAQRINASGVVQWTANGIAICTAANEQSAPTITSVGAGGAVITWNDYRSGTNFDIYAQRINASGVVQWTANGVAICTAANTQLFPTITSDNAGGAIVAWTDNRSGANHIYAQRISVDGVSRWMLNGVPICLAQESQTSPKLVSDNVRGSIVTWRDYRSGGPSYYAIFAQRIDSTGAVQWTQNGVLALSAADINSDHNIVGDESGGVIVTCSKSSSLDIYAQRINMDGVVQWTSSGVAISTANFNEAPTITGDLHGGAIIAWQHYGGSAFSDIYAQRVNSNGSTQWTTNDVAVCSAPGSQVFEAIVGDGAGGAIIAWTDTRSLADPGDIYAQQVNNNGLLGVITSVARKENSPQRFTLSQNYPNPFNPSTKIEFQIPNVSQVSVKVFDLLGREVAVLVNEHLSAGSYETEWNATSFASDVYYYQMRAGDFVQTKKLLLLR